MLRKAPMPLMGCKCTKSNCLRLHCSCFKRSKLCGISCECKGCINAPEHKEAIDFVVQKTKKIYKKAFDDVVIDYHGQPINSEGCRCTTNCLNNYCGCFKLDVVCSGFCKCTGC